MEKHKLLSLVKKTSGFFDEYSTPTSIYQSIWRDFHFKPLLDRMSPKDIIFYCFLAPVYLKGQDIDETYDNIEYSMYSVELVEIYDTEPEIDCPSCRNGYEPCDNCDGTGEVECNRCDNTGSNDCEYCDGTGQDEEGDECSSCEGTGKESCNYCYGSGYESCDWCGGDGEITCSDCDGAGNILSQESCMIQYLDYVSWNSRWKEYFFNKKPDEQIDSEDARNFGFNSQTILLGTSEEISENYEGYENGDVLLYVNKDTKDLNLNLGHFRILP
jgi:hypothetical protein